MAYVLYSGTQWQFPTGEGAEWSKTPYSGDTIAVFLGILIIVLPSPLIVNGKVDNSLIHYFSTIAKSHDSHLVSESLFYFAKSLATFIIQKRTSSESCGQRPKSSFMSGFEGGIFFCALIAADFAAPEGIYPCFSGENAVCLNPVRDIF